MCVVTVYRFLYFYANSVDPDQTPRFVAPHLGRHSFTSPSLGDARHKRVNFVAMKIVYFKYYMCFVQNDGDHYFNLVLMFKAYYFSSKILLKM